jgi:hypothetical protein
VLGRSAYFGAGFGVACCGQPRDISCGFSVVALLAEPCGQCLAAGYGFKAPGVAAPAGRIAVGHPDVADIAGGAFGPSVQLAAGDDAAADTRPNLDKERR